MKSQKPDGTHDPVKLFLTVKFIDEFAFGYVTEENQYSDAQITEALDTLKSFLGDLICSEEVTKLALKKCKLNLEEAMMMVTSEDQVQDLQEEIRREQEQHDILANQQ